MSRHSTNVGELTVAATGVQVTTGAASARQAIPNNASAGVAKYVFVSALSGAAYVRPGDSSVVATANDLPVVLSQGIVLNVTGMTHIAYIQETAAVKLNIVPLEVG